MPKQKGGYPFTDSWFEFPFWILFLIILIVIGLAVGGIFNSKSIPPSKPLISGQTWHQPEFDITNAYMENNEAVITYVTNQPYQGLKVKLRLVDGKTNNPWQDFSIGTKTVRIQPKNLTLLGLSVEGYIDYEGTPVTPVTSVPVTKDTKNNSGTGKFMPFPPSNNSGSGSYTPPSNNNNNSEINPIVKIYSASYNAQQQQVSVKYSVSNSISKSSGIYSIWFRILVNGSAVSDDIAQIPISVNEMNGSIKDTNVDMFLSNSSVQGSNYVVEGEVHNVSRTPVAIGTKGQLAFTIDNKSMPKSTSSSGSGSIVPPPSSKPTMLPGVPTPSTQKNSLPGSLHENFWPF